MNITNLAAGFKEEEIGFREKPMPSSRVVVIKDNKIMEEGNKETNK